jgi:hypothetical protein
MDIEKISSQVASDFIAKLPEHLEDDKFTKNDPDNPNPKGNDRDGDGKTNEAKPFKGSDVPKGVVAALTQQGDIKIFAADDAKAAHGIKMALMGQDGKYANIVHGPNHAGRTVNELYDHFEERWAGDVPDAFKKNWKNKGKGDDDKKDDGDKDDKKPDFLKKKDD